MSFRTAGHFRSARPRTDKKTFSPEGRPASLGSKIYVLLAMMGYFKIF